MDCIITVDIGTTSTKVMAFTLKGEVVADTKNGYPILNPKPNFHEQSISAITDAVLKGLKEIIGQCKSRNYEIVGISLCSAMHSVIAMNAKGNPLTNCIIWADTRSYDLANHLRGTEEGKDIYLHTGTPIHPMSPLCKIAWIRDNQPDIFSKTDKFVSIKEFLVFRLFGKYLSDYSIASATGLFNLQNLNWYGNALDFSGITKDNLPDLVPTSHKLQGLKKEFANELDIRPDIPFIIGASDGCLANLGSNAITPGNAALTIGTSGAIRVASSVPKTDAKERTFCYLLEKNYYIVGGAVNNGGVVLNWFKENFAEGARSSDKIDVKNLNQQLIESASHISPGANGLIFLPYLLGERSPHWDANSRGVFFGVDITHTRAHFVRAVLEGILYGILTVGKSLEDLNDKIQVIYASGGFTASKTWVQMLSDIFNTKVQIIHTSEASSMGAALMGMKALQIIPNYDNLSEYLKVVDNFMPDKEKHKIYNSKVKIFEELYQNLKKTFKKLNT